MYFDTCYIAKFYLNESESPRVRKLVRESGAIFSSLWVLTKWVLTKWAFTEFQAVVHRQMREGTITPSQAAGTLARFTGHVDDGLWHLIPVTGAMLRRTAALIAAAPPQCFIRAADAAHLVTARENGEQEIWTNDRHMTAAAAYFGLAARSV